MRYRAVWDAGAYTADHFSPVEPAVLAETGQIRSQRVGLLRFQPYQYNPANGLLRYAGHVRVRVRLPAAAGVSEMAAPAAVLDEGPFERALEHGLLNYAQARGWRTRPAALNAPAVTADLDGPAIKLIVPADGLYRVTQPELLAAGLPANADPRSFRLLTGGEEAAIALTGEADGIFDPSDELRFYGQKLETSWSSANVYRLTWGGVGGLRMASRTAAPGAPLPSPAGFTETLHVEKNLKYVASKPSTPEKDRWYWELIAASGAPVTHSYTFAAPAPAPAGAALTLRGVLYGNTALPEHHTRILLNDHLAHDFTWPARGETAFEVSLPAAWLLEGNNTLKITAVMDAASLDSAYLNWFELVYTRRLEALDGELAFATGPQAQELRVGGFTGPDLLLYDISDPLHPVEIARATVDSLGGERRLRFAQEAGLPHRWLALEAARLRSPAAIFMDAPSDLRSPDNAADYIIIAHDDYYTASLPLAAFRRTQGLHAAVVRLQDVYDEFGGGRVDPEAIRSFLAHAYAGWQPPAPAYVLLMGDGHYDPKNYLGYNDFRFLPPYLADVDYFLGETAADNRYVSISGDDTLPDMALGRLPVRSAAEAAAVVAKIIAYETTPAPGDWKRRVMLAADNADEAGDFAYLSDLAANASLPPIYQQDRVYLGSNYPNPEAAPPVAATHAITTGLNAGRLVVSYVGHGAIRWWADEKLFGREQLAKLNNAGRLPFFVAMTCLDGYYINPYTPANDQNSLAEALVTAAGKGAIASFSPAGYGVATGHDYLERGLFTALFIDYVDRLGPATVLAKLYLHQSTAGFDDLIETYTLFGDPATRLPVSRPLWLPMIQK